MMRIMKAVDYMDKELKHAYKFLEYAIEAKTESPELFETYLKISECEAQNAENIHTVIVRMIERQSLDKEHEPPKAMKDIWNWQHKNYIEEYAHFRTKLESTKKMM